MKKILYIYILTFCLFGIPAEEWEAMNDERQDAVLDGIIQDTIFELNCEEAVASVFVKGKLVFIYGECTDVQYAALGHGL